MSEWTRLGLKHTKTILIGKTPVPQLTARKIQAYVCFALAHAGLTQNWSSFARASSSQFNTRPAWSDEDILVAYLVGISGHPGMPPASVIEASVRSSWNRPTCALDDNAPSPSQPVPPLIHLRKYRPTSSPWNHRNEHSQPPGVMGIGGDIRNGVTAGATAAVQDMR